MDRSSYKEHKFQHRRKAYKFSWACWGCRRSTAPPIIDILCLMHLQPHLAVEDVQPVIGNFRDTLVNLVQRRSLCEGVEDGRLEDFDQLQLTPPLHFKPSKSSGRTVMDSQGLGLHKKCDRVLWGVGGLKQVWSSTWGWEWMAHGATYCWPVHKDGRLRSTWFVSTIKMRSVLMNITVFQISAKLLPASRLSRLWTTNLSSRQWWTTQMHLYLIQSN